MPIRVHWSFSLLVLLVLVSARGASSASIIATVLWLVALFASVTLHELSHSIVAMRLGLKVRDIVLLPIGGVSEIEGMDATPQIESRVAIAGPLASVVIGGVLLLIGLGTGATMWPPTLTSGSWLVNIGWLNLLLAAFNMLPALPMDGGRVFRSTLARFGNGLRATRIASGMAAVIGVGMIVVGLQYNVFLVLIGGFVLFGSFAEMRNARFRSAVQSLTVVSLMHRDETTVPTTVPAGEVSGWLWHFPGRAIPVVDELGRYVGIVSLRDLAATPPYAPVGSACDRLAPLLTPDMPVYPTVIQAFQSSHRNDLAVADGGRIVGVLYLPAVSDAFTRAQAGAPA